MRFFIDNKNYFLSKILDGNFLSGFTSSWIFYDQRESVNMDDLFNNDKKIFSFLWEYSDNTFLKKIDEWKRALNRNRIEIPQEIERYFIDYQLDIEKKIYLDIIEADFSFTKNTFDHFTAYNRAGHLSQIVVESDFCFFDLDLTFLDDKNDINRFKRYIALLDLDSIHTIILNGYHHAGELIKILVHKKDIQIVSEENVLPWNIFENTYVSWSFGWS